jgi:glycosyltransferase involved in cell wall biosynthesis
MKILLIHQYYMRNMDVPGGARWNEMTRVWVQKGHEVSVIASMYDIATARKLPCYKGKIFRREKLDNGLDVIRVHTSERYDRNFFWRAWAYFTFVFFGFLGALFFAKGKYDVVLASSPPLLVGPLGISISFFKRCKFIFEVRDLWPESAIDTGAVTNPFLIKLMFWMEKCSYRYAEAINVLTPAFKEKLIKNKSIAEDKVWLIPNAADLELIKPGPKDEKIIEKHSWQNKFVALYIGAHGRANCLWQLIEAAKILKDEPEFIIACLGGGMERSSLIAEAEQFGLSNIQFLPVVSKKKVGSYIRTCDVSLVVLKKVDTFKTVYPNKMFDSMSAAKPIIIAIDGVARKLVVDDAKSGMYVEPENAREIADKIRFYCNSSEIAKQHGQNGYNFVREHFDRHKLAEKYIELIREKIEN